MYQVAPIIFGDAVDAVTATASTELGTERFVGEKKYRYVYNGGGAVASKWSPVTVLTAAVGINTITVSTTAGHMVRGVTTVSIPAASYGWVQLQGPVTISCGSGSSSLDLGAQQVGTDGVIKTHIAAGYPMGNLNTAVVSGNTGLLWLQIP